MNFLEKDLEDIIWENISNIETLQNRGLDLHKECNYYRQFDLQPYGIPDILGFGYDSISEQYTVHLIELKKEAVGVKALVQAIRYYTGIKNMMQEKGLKHIVFHVDIIGSNVEHEVLYLYQKLAVSMNMFLSIMTYNFDLEKGLRFEMVNNHGWHRKHNGYSSIFKIDFEGMKSKALKEKEGNDD